MLTTQLSLFSNDTQTYQESSLFEKKDLPELNTPNQISQALAHQDKQNILNLVEIYASAKQSGSESISELYQQLNRTLLNRCVDAQRWNSFSQTHNLKMVGWSGCDPDSKAPKGFSYVHLEAWTSHPEKTSAEHQAINRNVLNQFADNATYCMKIKPIFFKKRNNV